MFHGAIYHERLDNQVPECMCRWRREPGVVMQRRLCMRRLLPQELQRRAEAASDTAKSKALQTVVEMKVSCHPKTRLLVQHLV